MPSNQNKDTDKPQRGSGEKQSENKGGSQQSGTPGSGSRQSEKDDQQRNRQTGQTKPERKANEMDE